MVVIDGFGLDAWRREKAANPFLRGMTATGVVKPLTSMYPSETAEAIITLET
jgi:predicted AlkP superfamily pyrophosphatase or phosphodiesterase